MAVYAPRFVLSMPIAVDISALLSSKSGAIKYIVFVDPKINPHFSFTIEVLEHLRAIQSQSASFGWNYLY